jgi:hypothetical protein
MTCDRCGAYAQGQHCRQCETELKYAHLDDDEGSLWDRDDEEGHDE